MSSWWPDVLLLQLVDPVDGRLGRDEPRLALLLELPVAGRDAEHADQRRQRQALERRGS